MIVILEFFFCALLHFAYLHPRSTLAAVYICSLQRLQTLCTDITEVVAAAQHDIQHTCGKDDAWFKTLQLRSELHGLDMELQEELEVRASAAGAAGAAGACCVCVVDGMQWSSLAVEHVWARTETHFRCRCHDTRTTACKVTL